MRILPAFLLLAASCAAPCLASEAPTREHLAPEGYERAYHEVHYTPVVKIGHRVIVSGIPAAFGQDEEDRVRWAFRELQRHLELAGATLADVVELQSFHLASGHQELSKRMETVLKVHAEFFPSHYPAWTAVGTTALLSGKAPMELRAEAVIGSGRAPHAAIPPPPPRSLPGPASAPVG